MIKPNWLRFSPTLPEESLVEIDTPLIFWQANPAVVAETPLVLNPDRRGRGIQIISIPDVQIIPVEEPPESIETS